MLEALTDNRETLLITNFLSLKKAKIDLGNITAIIGPQASGKSVIVKLIFFGRRYLSRLLISNTGNDFSLRHFKRIQISEFNKIFGDLDGYPGEFEVKYRFSGLSIKISRGRDTSQIKISHSKSLDSVSAKVRRSYLKYFKNAAEKRPRGLTSHMFQNNIEEKFFDSVPETIFVPASRSFYSTVSDELFTFLASNERVDPLTAQFGSYYEFARRRLSGELKVMKKGLATSAQKAMRPVLLGDFVRVRFRDYIQTSWGRVQLRFASSGQQEVLPLFLTLLDFPEKSQHAQQLIIEEPEAHLFPTAQKYVLDFMVGTACDNFCDMLFTTHSPYLIACLNNHIAKRKNEDDFPIFYAYLANEGTVVDITDAEGFIDANFLDSVSQDIAEEFLEAIE